MPKVAKILHIEDNVDHAELVHRTLSRHAIKNEIRHELDGASALEYLFGCLEKNDSLLLPDLILLDLRLPKVDGLDVLGKIKEHEILKKIPVVVMTSSHNEEDIQAAYARFVNSYIVKPLDFQRFKELMDDVGHYWLGWNRQ